jgi:hypothetical protein
MQGGVLRKWRRQLWWPFSQQRAAETTPAGPEAGRDGPQHEARSPADEAVAAAAASHSSTKGILGLEEDLSGPALVRKASHPPRLARHATQARHSLARRSLSTMRRAVRLRRQGLWAPPHARVV